jgi:hypothetical protein
MGSMGERWKHGGNLVSMTLDILNLKKQRELK